MKRYTDFTKEELVNLTTEQIQNLIDIEIAFEGIIPLPVPQDDPVAEVDIQPTVEAWQVNDVFYCNKEEAITAAGLSAAYSNYDYNEGGYDYKYLLPRENDGLKKVMFYNKADLHKVGKLLVNRKRAQENNSRLTKEYELYQKSIFNISNSVYDAIHIAQNWVRSISQARANYDHYLELSEGDKAIAWNFFTNTYKAEEIVKAIGFQLGKELLNNHEELSF